MRCGFLSLLACVMVLAGTGEASDFNLTTRLLTAKPGSWIRRRAPHGYVITQMVAAVDAESVTLRLIRHHHGRRKTDVTKTFSAEYIKQHGADPDAPSARKGAVDYGGKTLNVSIVKMQSDKGTSLYYISDAMPASGLVCVELLDKAGKVTYTIWTDEYGNEPDELIRKAMEKKPAP